MMSMIKTTHRYNLSLILLLMVFQVALLKAQKDYKWGETTAITENIPASFNDNDAIMIYEKEEIQSKYDLTRRIIKRRIKIQTELGLDKYARIVVPKLYQMRITILDARTIKQDGSVVDLSSKDIKEIEINNDDDIFDKEEYYIFKVPGVEVGDEIEMICIYEGFVYYSGGTVILHTYLPVMDAQYTLKIERSLPFTAARYNGMAEPKTQNNLNGFSCTWTLKNLPGLYDQRSAIAYNTIPYSIYDYSMGQDRDSWAKLILSIDEQVSDVRIRSKKKLNAILATIIGDKANASKIEQAKAVHDYINKEIKIVSISESEQSNGIEYFYEEKKADFITTFQMYHDLMDRLDLDYHLAIGRSRYLGGFHIDYPSFFQISNYLFLVADENKNLQIFPLRQDAETYEVNEIPIALEESTLLSMDMSEKDSVVYFKIPQSAYKKNRRLRKIKTLVNLTDNTIEHACTEKMDGAVSTDVRHYYNKAKAQNNLKETFEEILSDRITDATLISVKSGDMPGKPPFKYDLSYIYRLKNKINKIDEKLFKIDISGWVPHKKYQVNADKRVLDYHPLFSGIDAFNYYLEFDHPITLINKEQMDIKVENSVGSYELTVNQIKENTLSIRSKYIIKTNHIPVKDIQQLADLNEAVNKADAEGIIVEAK